MSDGGLSSKFDGFSIVIQSNWVLTPQAPFNETESAITDAGDTWRSWGVPANAKVTKIELINYDLEHNELDMASQQTEVLIVDENDDPVTAAVLSVDSTLRVAATTTVSGNGEHDVLAAYQESSQQVRLKVVKNTVKSSASSVCGSNYEMDNVLLKITYIAFGGFIPLLRVLQKS